MGNPSFWDNVTTTYDLYCLDIAPILAGSTCRKHMKNTYEMHQTYQPIHPILRD